ncbi:hypothetical protein BHE74_00039195 [Ensete ventricosum]|nr:hypothetical protein BHE74_00039195 [Ensete ventricosum]
MAYDKVGDFELYRPVRAVHISPLADQYANGLLPGGTTDWGCFRPVTTRNQPVMVDFDRRRPISRGINRGTKKEEGEPGVQHCSSPARFVAHGRFLLPVWGGVW